jgi:hypothetical protein
MRVRQQRVSARRSLLLVTVAAAAMLSAVPAVGALGLKMKSVQGQIQVRRSSGVGSEGPTYYFWKVTDLRLTPTTLHPQQKDQEKIEASVQNMGGRPDTMVIDIKEGDKAKGEAKTVKVTLRECKAVAGRDGQAELGPVFASLKGCPTALVTLVSPAEGGPAAYSWSEPSVAADIPNLLIYGSGAAQGKGKKDEVRAWAWACGCGCVDGE